MTPHLQQACCWRTEDVIHMTVHRHNERNSGACIHFLFAVLTAHQLRLRERRKKKGFDWSILPFIYYICNLLSPSHRCCDPPYFVWSTAADSWWIMLLQWGEPAQWEKIPMNSDLTVHAAVTSAGIGYMSDFGPHVWKWPKSELKKRIPFDCTVHTVIKKQIWVTYGLQKNWFRPLLPAVWT